MDRAEKKQVIDLDARLASAAHFQSQGRLQEAAKICREILDRLPGQADALHLAGILAFQKGDAPKAVDLITRAIQNFPHNPFYHHDLGLIHKTLGEPEKAISCFRKAVVIKPDFAEAYYNTGAAMQLLEDYDRAIDSYQKALEIRPDLSEALTSIGIVLQIQGRFERAAAYFRKAIELQPGRLNFFIILRGHWKIWADLMRRFNPIGRLLSFDPIWLRHTTIWGLCSDSREISRKRCQF